MHPELEEEAGRFEEISLSLLLVRALDQRWSGTLIIEPPFDLVHLIQFDRGLVCRVLVPDNYARLGELIVEAGVIMQSELDIALEYDGLLGQSLARQRLIDARTLQRALVLQIIKRMVRLFDFPLETEWTFMPDLEAFEDMPEGVRVDTLRILWAGISAHGEMGDWIDATLTRIGESPFRVREDVQLARFGFTGDAARLVGVINGGRTTVSELLDREVTPEDVCRRIVYLLAITRYLEFTPAGDNVDSAEPLSSSEQTELVDEPTSSGEDDRPSQQPQRVARIKLKRVTKRGAGDTPARDSSPPAEGTSGSSGDILAEIKSRLERLEKESPLTLLNLTRRDLERESEAALTERLWLAYERAARRWHPDNCPHDLIELREGMTKLHRAITLAFETLADPERRERCLRELDQREEEVHTSSGEREVPLDVQEVVEGASRREPRRLARTWPSVPQTDGEGAGDEARATPPSGRRTVDNLTPGQLHERALVAMSEQRLTEALRLCLLACEAAPENPDYVASSIWIRACVPQPDLKMLTLDLDDLLLHYEDHVPARYYRGVLRRRLGYDSAAKQDFERVLALDPEHAGARQHLDEMAAPSRLNG